MLLNGLIQKMRGQALVVSGLPEGIEVERDRSGNQFMLAWLIQHAMDNGCIGLRLGVNHDSTKSWSWLNYLGPHWHRRPSWVRIVPPDTENYPILLQVCLSFAEVELGCLPIRGQVPVIRSGKRSALELEIRELASFQLTWDKGLALAQMQVEREGRVFPDEDNPRSDGDAAQPA